MTLEPGISWAQPCNLCGRLFKDVPALKQHQRDKHPNGEPGLARCPFCGSVKSEVTPLTSLFGAATVFAVRCCSCRGAGPAGESATSAMQKWNVRR